MDFLVIKLKISQNNFSSQNFRQNNSSGPNNELRSLYRIQDGEELKKTCFDSPIISVNPRPGQ